MNEDISDQEQNSIFESADKMQTVPVRKDESLKTGHVGRDVVQQTGFWGSRTEVDAMHRSVERMAVGDVEHNRISFEAILGHLQEEAVPETGPSGSGLGSNEGQQVVHTGSVTCMATLKSNSVTVIHQDTVPNRAVLNGKKPGIGNQEEYFAEDLSSPDLEASICGGQLADNTGLRTEVNDSDVDMEAVDGEELVQNESPKDHQHLGKDDVEEGQVKSLFDFNDISIEQHKDTWIYVEQLEPEQSVNVLDNNVNVEQIFKCSDKSVTEIEKKESSTTMVALSMPEPDLDDEFNEIVMKVKTELLAVSSQGDGTDDAELGGDDTNSAQDEIYFVDSQVENIHPNVSSNGSMAIILAGESGAINTEAVDRTEITELDHKIGLSTMMDMEVSGPVSHDTEYSHPSSVNSLDNKNYGKEEVFETGSALIVEKISVKDSRQLYAYENGCQPMKSAEQEQLIQETKEVNNDTVQQNIESVDTKEKVHGLINIVLKSVENVELKNTSFHQMVETSDMATHLASEVEGTIGVPVSHNQDIVDNSHLVKDIASIQQQSMSVDAVEIYQNVAFHEKESSMEISDPGKQLNHVVETEKGFDNIGKEDFIFGEKEFAQEVSYTEGIMDQEVASFKMQDDTEKLISCFEEDFAKEASNTGQQDNDNTMSDRSLQNILVNEKATYQRDTSYKLNVLSGIEDNSTSVLLDSGLSGIEENSTSVLLDSRLSGIEDNSTSVLLDSRLSGIEDNSASVLLDSRMEREQAVSLSQKESFEDISGEDNFSDITSFKDPFSEIMSNPEEKMEPGHVFIGSNKVEFVSVNDGKSTAVVSVKGRDRDQEIFSFENKSFQDISNPEEDSLKLVASFEKESSELIANPEEKIETGQMSIENNELEVLSDLDGKSTIVVSVQKKDRDQEISSFEKKSFQDISNPEENSFIPVASFEKHSSEVILDPEEKMEQGIVPVENNKLQVVSDTRQNSATVLSDPGKEGGHAVTPFEKKSFQDVSKPEEDTFSEVASFEEKSLESVSDPEEKIEHLHMSIENNELEVLSDHEKSSTVLSDQGKKRDQGIPMFQKESFEIVNNPDEDNFRNVASFEDSSTEVISNSEENMDPGHVTLENNEIEVLSDLDEKASTVLSVQGKERDQGIPSFEKESFEDISNREDKSLKLVTTEVIMNPEENIEPGHVSMENNELENLSDLDEKSTTVLSVQGKETNQTISLCEKEFFEDISNPEVDRLKHVASFEKESSEVISNPEEKMEPGLMSIENNNELAAISDLDKKSTTVLCVHGKEREHDSFSFEKKSFQDKSNPKELSFIPVASFEKEFSKVISDPKEKKEQGLVSVENNELEILSDLDKKSSTVLSVQGKERDQEIPSFEKESFEDISNPEETNLKLVACFEKEASEEITNPKEKMEPGHVSMENSELKVISDHEKSSTVLSEHGKVDRGISLFQKENVTVPKEDNFRHVSSFEDSSSEIISIFEDKMDSGHMSLENNELEVLSNLDEKSTTVLSDPGRFGDHAVTLFEKKSFQDVSIPEDDTFSEVASFEDKSLELGSDPKEKIEHGHMLIENNELKVLPDLDENSINVQSVKGKERDQEIPIFEKESFEDISNPEKDNLKHVASFENESTKVITNPEENKEPGHNSLENNELEVLSACDEKSTTVQSVQGKERNQTVSLCEKEFFEDISKPEVDRLKHVASFEKESSEVVSNPEEKMKPGQMSIENSVLEVLSDLDKKSASVLSDPGKERDHAVALFIKVSLQDISNPEEKMEQGHVSVEKNDLEFLSDLDEKSAKGEGLGAVLLDDKCHDADKKCRNSLSYEKTDESYAAVCQDEAQERQSFSRVETKLKMEIFEDDHSFSDQSNTGDREGTQQGCSQDLFENSSQWNVSRIGCTDMIYGIALAELKSVETVESVSKSGKKRKLSEIFEENDAADDDNGCVSTGVPLKKMLLPENEHSGKSFSKDEVIKDKSLVRMDCYEMQSPLEHKTIDTKVVLENDTVESYSCATSSVQNTDSGRQQFLPENDREIENNNIRKYFPGEDQSTLPVDCGGKTSEFKDNASCDKETICIVDTVEDSSSSMNLTFSNERQYLPENCLQTNEFLSRVSSKEISDTENHERVEDCNVAMNDEDCTVESPTDSLRLLSSELARHKDVESSELVIGEDVKSEFVMDKDAETSELSEKSDDSSELVMDKDAEVSELVMDKDAESSELVIDKGAESSELVMDKDAESSELGDTNAESSELVMDKDAESSEIVIDEDAELSELVMDKDAESSELVMDKDAESSELVMDKDAESSELVMDKDAESSEIIIDEDAELSELVMEKDAESSELVIDEDAESSELVTDKDAESSELVINEDAELSELVLVKDAESSELVMDKDAESSELVVNRDVESSVLVCDTDSELSVNGSGRSSVLSENGNSGSVENDHYINDSCIKDNPERLHYFQDEETTSTIEPCDQSEGSSQRSDDLHTGPAMHPDLDTANEKAWKKRGCGEEINRDVDELLSVQTENRDKQGEFMQLTDKSIVLNAKKTWQLSETRMKNETKYVDFAPYVEGHDEEMKPCSSPESETLISVASDDWDANSDVAMDTTENDTDNTLNDSTMKCLPFISAPENVISVDQVKETSTCFIWSTNHLVDFSQQHAMSPVIPQQARIFPKTSTDDQDELLFSDQSDDDDNGISSLKISALVDEIQKTPIVDEAGSLLEKTPNFSSNVVSSSLEFKNEAISKRQRSDDSDQFNLDVSNNVDDVIYDDDDDDDDHDHERPAYDRYKDVKEDNVSNVNQSDQENVEDEDDVNENEESKASSSVASSSSSQESLGETPSNSSQHNQFPPEGDHEKVTTLVTRCKSILEKFRKILNRQMDILQTHRIQALIDELEKIEKWSELPQIVIAVVGNTGDGKSSLINALLGHSSILPTSGIRACTAVVVEVVQNSGSLYEGCIEFLTEEEWYSELKKLIDDLTSPDGKLRKKPDPGSDLYASYCKVKAVYGKIDRFEILAEINNVTSHLGQKRNVKCKQAEEFRSEVERYIETQEPQSGGQFWPIVKRVQLRLPNCDVCRTGAVLVDLPGVRDSNPARVKIARDYLKTCSAIWVVAAIHRAIDDKTAQDLLTDNFRRQLLMDGQYGSVAFICTKSDQFENSEIIRTLKLQDKCKDHEEQISYMEKEKQRLLRSFVQHMDANQNQIQELETQIRQRRRKLSHICASARNDYCREKIKQKFQSWFKEIKRQANRLPDVDDDEEEEDEEEEEEDAEDAEEVNRMVNSLKVFCCSSTEYQKLKEFLPADGKPTVFSSPEETEIPSLQAYVHKLTRIRHEQYLERLIKGLGRCTFNFQSYLLDGGTECVETRTGVKLVIEKYLQDLKSMIQPVLQKMAEDLESTFNDMVQPKFHEGVGLATQEVTGICQKWGSKPSTDHANRRAGGLHLATYKATIQRLGVYSSPTFGSIDMNEELSEPFFRTISVVWRRVFRSVLWKILETVKTDILERIQQFNQKVGSELQKMVFPTNRIDQMKEQVELSVKYKLTEMVLLLKPKVTAKQRDISRILSPHVQSDLVETYSKAASHTGNGTFQRMKQEMESGIDARKMYIFDDGSQKMMHELLNLKTELVNTVTAVCDWLLEEIQLSFEPLLKDPSQSVLLRDTLQQYLEEVCEEMRTIYRDASLQNTEEHAQSHKKPATTQHPPTPKRPQERKKVDDIVNMFISPVPEELTKKLEVLKVEKGSHMHPVKDVKQKPGLSSDSGIHNQSDIASSSGIDVTRIKMEVLSEFIEFLNHYNVEPPSLRAMLPSEDSVNPTSMAGPSNVYDFGEASVTKNIQHDQTHKKIKVSTKQRHNSIAPKNVPPEVRLALENHMVKRSKEHSFKHGHAIVPIIAKQQTEKSSIAAAAQEKAKNSSIAVAAQEEALNSARGSSRAMVSLLNPKPGTSTAAKEKQLAEISISDSRQLIPAKRKTSSTSTMETSTSGQAGTSLIRPKETTSKGTERNSCDSKGNPSSDLKRTAPSVNTGTTACGIKTPLPDKMGTSLPIIEDDDSLPEIPIAKRRKKTYREQNNPLYKNVQVKENPTCTHGTGKLSQKISTDTSLSSSSVSSKPRLLSNSKTEATSISKTQNSNETTSSKSPQRNKLRIEPSMDNSSSSEMLQIIKQEPQEVDHFPHKHQSRRKQTAAQEKAKNSSIAAAAQEEAENSTRGSSRAMVSLLKPKRGTSTAAKKKQLAEMSISDSRQLIPAKRKTSCTSTMEISSSGQAGTSLIRPKETTSKGTEGNSCDIKGNPSSDLKRTAPSINTDPDIIDLTLSDDE